MPDKTKISTRDLIMQVDDTRKDCGKRVHTAVRDMCISGEMRRIDVGLYAYIGKGKQPVEKRDAMWRLLRARRAVTVDDLVTLCGVADGYAQEWLRMLVKNEAVRKTGDTYRLVKDTGPKGMPGRDDNAAKLRDIRRKKRQAALDNITRAAAEIGRNVEMLAGMMNEE
jgi:hypothetical protein